MQTDTRYSVAEAAKILGVHPDTLRRWEDQGRVTPERTPTGHRRFTPAMIEALRNPNS